MKRLLLFSLLSLSYINSFAQWDSLQAGVKGNAIPYSGSAAVYTLLSSAKEMYVGGQFDTVDGMPASGIASWNGTNWNIITKVQKGGYVLSMIEDNNNLIVGGNFDSVNGHPSTNVVQWNGANWTSVGTTCGIGFVEDMAVYNGNLYVGGISALRVVNEWNGTTWAPPLKTIKSSSPYGVGVYTMAVYNNKLYIGGCFDSINGKYIRNLATWNDTVWAPVNNNMLDSTIGALCVCNNKLYVGGYITKKGSISSVGIVNEWDGTNWNNLGNSITDYGYIYALAANGSDLYAAGRFDSIGGIQAASIAYWDGATWNSAGAGIQGTAYALANYRGGIYAGGSFSYAGPLQVNNIASYQGPNSINELSQTNGVSVYPNPSNGLFNYELKITNYESNTDKMEVYNMLGENVILSFFIPNSQFVIDLTGQPNGIYLYRITDKNGVAIATGKLVISK